MRTDIPRKLYAWPLSLYPSCTPLLLQLRTQSKQHLGVPLVPLQVLGSRDQVSLCVLISSWQKLTEELKRRCLLCLVNKRQLLQLSLVLKDPCSFFINRPCPEVKKPTTESVSPSILFLDSIQFFGLIVTRQTHHRSMLEQDDQNIDFQPTVSQS